MDRQWFADGVQVSEIDSYQWFADGIQLVGVIVTVGYVPIYVENWDVISRRA